MGGEKKNSYQRRGRGGTSGVLRGGEYVEGGEPPSMGIKKERRGSRGGRKQKKEEEKNSWGEKGTIALTERGGTFKKKKKKKEDPGTTRKRDFILKKGIKKKVGKKFR